jgi:hypothetical protein
VVTLRRKRGIVGAILATGLIVTACGGNSATSAPTTAPSSRAQATQQGQGEVIDVAGVQAAVEALKTGHDAWQFKATTYQSGTPNFSRTLTGTQRTKPSTAINVTVNQSGKPDQRYIRIANDVWFDTGTGAGLETTKASDRLVESQFKPYYLDGLVTTAETEGYLYVAVGPDSVAGVPTTHYRLADDYIADIVRNLTGITAADWAADLWIADADDSLLRMTWGPQSLDRAQLQLGADWQVTSLDCTCPVEPPAASPS